MRQLLEGGGRYVMEGSFPKPSVPSYASLRILDLVTQRERWKEYTVREAVVRPHNPNNEATEWEVGMIARFQRMAEEEQAHPGVAPEDPLHLQGMRTTESGEQLIYFARALMVPTVSCLHCHGARSEAPPAMLEAYPLARAFDWQLGEIVGAQIVTIPTAIARIDARRNAATTLVSLIAIFSLLFIVLNGVLGRSLLTPLRQTLADTEKASLGSDMVGPLDENQPGELGELNRAINRLRHSLKRALELAAESVGQDEPE